MTPEQLQSLFSEYGTQNAFIAWVKNETDVVLDGGWFSKIITGKAGLSKSTEALIRLYLKSTNKKLPS